jgi:hypothetical protein
MRSTLNTFLVLFVFIVFTLACAPKDTSTTNASSGNSTANSQPQPTPSNKFTTADIAKLKWLEGSWRGMDGDKPFFERYKVEENAMVTETLKKDGSVDGPPDRFELKNGEFRNGEGDKSSAATEITDEYVQFVPSVPGHGYTFRFTKQGDGWEALLDLPATDDRSARQKTYRMERWNPPNK